MNVFYSIGQFAAHLVVSTLVFIGLKATTPAIPVPVSPPPPPAIITPLTTSDVVGIEQAKLPSQRPYLIQPIQNITINNPAPVQQKTMTDETLNAPAATPASTPAAAAPVEDTVPAYNIGIFSPVARAALGNPHTARAVPLDEENFVVLGAVLTDKDGNNVHHATMNITTPDHSQDKMLMGTGTNENGKFYYPYQYDFTRTGDHVITFEANGVSKSITITINQEDTRPDPAQ